MGRAIGASFSKYIMPLIAVIWTNVFKGQEDRPRQNFLYGNLTPTHTPSIQFVPVLATASRLTKTQILETRLIMIILWLMGLALSVCVPASNSIIIIPTLLAVVATQVD
jgi:hypothetical protein